MMVWQKLKKDIFEDLWLIIKLMFIALGGSFLWYSLWYPLYDKTGVEFYWTMANLSVFFPFIIGFLLFVHRTRGFIKEIKTALKKTYDEQEIYKDSLPGEPARGRFGQ